MRHEIIRDGNYSLVRGACPRLKTNGTGAVRLFADYFMNKHPRFSSTHDYINTLILCN
jgi:hypothetical protein